MATEMIDFHKFAYINFWTWAVDSLSEPLAVYNNNDDIY